MALAALIIAFGASLVGGICGIGGGIIIKPLLDLMGFASVSTVSFLSGCTVLSMSLYNVVKSRLEHSKAVDPKTGVPLAVGAAAGGAAGSACFKVVCTQLGSENIVGAAQAAILLLLVLGTVLYTLFKKKIHPLYVHSTLTCTLIGLALGALSSFLGIGGGPFNLVVLHYFLGQDTKQAVENSLFIILLSQLTNILISLLTHSVPAFAMSSLLLMIAGGIGGGVAGKRVSKKLSEAATDKLFIGLLCLIILICIYNIIKHI